MMKTFHGIGSETLSIVVAKHTFLSKGIFAQILSSIMITLAQHPRMGIPSTLEVSLIT